VAPDYFFCAAFWLVANERLGSASSWWEEHAWYSDPLARARLPIARAREAEPEARRRPCGQRLCHPAAGSVANRRGTAELLLRAGHRVAEVALDSSGVFEFADLAEGLYTLQLPTPTTAKRCCCSRGSAR
jgi:hypothetical protein